MNQKNKLYFCGEAEELLPALMELEKEMPFQICAGGEGFPVEIVKAETDHAACDGKKVQICYSSRPAFFRLFALALGRIPETFEMEMERQFDELGVMFDLSRNGVMKTAAFEQFVRRLAVMGYTYIWLYMEDIYEVENLPYFGYLRGRYSREELSHMDAYAARFGIEVIPCIQTLGHLEKYLRWPEARELMDMENVLMVGSEETRVFLRRILTAATEPFSTRRIHLGMDEAWGLGTGRYLEKNGYKPSLEIMRQHLGMIMELCRELGLEPVIWSDMFFRSNGGDYYDEEPFTAEQAADIRATIPEGIRLVYWDYYHHEKEEYLNFLKKHQQICDDIYFAGGVWTWSGVTPNQGKALSVSKAALEACRELNIGNVCCTMWGDNGAEISPLSALLSLQFFSEYAYRKQEPELEEVYESFRICQREDGRAFCDLRLLDELPGIPKGNPSGANPSKYLLYQNPLYGMFDKNVENYLRQTVREAGYQDEQEGMQDILFAHEKELPSLHNIYAQLAEKMNGYREASPEFSLLFAHYANLADFLSDKAELGCAVRLAYQSGSRAYLESCIDRCKNLLEKLQTLVEGWNRLWRKTNKAIGFEAINVRLGALEAQLKYACVQLTACLERGEEIEELKEELLAAPTPGSQEGVQESPLNVCASLWEQIVTSNPVVGV